MLTPQFGPAFRTMEQINSVREADLQEIASVRGPLKVSLQWRAPLQNLAKLFFDWDDPKPRPFTLYHADGSQWARRVGSYGQ
jgi:hypothetical protein